MREGDRATMFEIFFDLVFVLALTRVVAFLETAPQPAALVEGLLLVVLLWWAWNAFIWLGNWVRLDRGVVLAGVVVAMSGLFVAALVIPQAWSQRSGALVLALAFTLVRLSYVVLFVRVSRTDPRLRHQVLLDAVPLALSSALLIVGAAAGGTHQTVLWACAFAVDFGLGRLASGYRGWRVGSPRHFVERHGLLLIVALGETLLSTGVGIGPEVTTAPVLSAALYAFLVAVGLWWLYFTDLSQAGETALVRAAPAHRPALARDVYTLGHFPLVAGVVYVAFGVTVLLNQVVEAPTGPAPAVDAVGAGALCGGVAVYLVGLVVFRRLTSGSTPVGPVGAAVLALAVIAVVRPGSPWSVLALVALVVASVVVAHVRRASRTLASL